MTAGALRQLAQREFVEGNFPAAERHCLALLDAEPRDSLAHYLLSNIAMAAGSHRRSVQHALAAAAEHGKYGPGHSLAVSMKLIAVGENGAAFGVLSSIDPRAAASAPHLVGVATQMAALDQHVESLKRLETAVARGAGGTVRYLLGNAYKFVGQLELAAAAYEQCISENPTFAYAHWGLAYLGRRFNRPGNIDRIRRALRALNGSAGLDAASLFFALFKELDAAGNVKEAWAALSRGCEIKDRLVDYDAAAERRIFERLAELPPAPSVAQAPDPAVPLPVFIVGMPRTGTTLLERILGSNPATVICGELNDLRMQYKWCSDHYCPGFFDAVAVERMASVDPGELGARYLSHVAWRVGTGAARFTDKNPGNYAMIGLIVAALPGARILHLRRNPMDSCFSNLKELFAGSIYPYSYRLDNLAAHFDNYSRLMEHWHQAAPGRILDVSYESLVREPEVAARRVMSHCGLPFDPAQLQIESNALPVSTASSAQVREPIHTRNIGGWQAYARQLEPLAAGLSGRGYPV